MLAWIQLAIVIGACLAGESPSPPAPLKPDPLPPQVQQDLIGLAQNSDVLVLGELHGTREVSEIGAALLEPLSKLGYGAIAVEIPHDQQQPLVRWATGQTETVPRFFRDPSVDGRGSLEALSLIRQGITQHKWHLICFDAEPPGMSKIETPEQAIAWSIRRDEAMAATLARERNRLTPLPKVLTICGNLHARTAKSKSSENPLAALWPSFAAKLQSDNPTWRVRSINIVPHGGTMFAALSEANDSQVPVAKVHPIRSKRRLETAEAHPLQEDEWDWELNLPQATAATFWPMAEAAKQK